MQKERVRDIGRGRSRLHAGNPMWDSIPGHPGSRPGLKADAQPLSHPGVPYTYNFNNCVLRTSFSKQ